MNMAKGRLVWTVMVGVCVCGGLMQGAHADEYHYENFRYGQRALGLGGAVVAYPGEPEMSYYNPAGLAMVGGAVFSGALQFYGLDSRTLTDSFRTGPWLDPKDETSDAFVVLPSSSVMSKSFGDGDEHVVAVSSFLSSHLEESFSGTARQPVDSPTWRGVGYQSSLGRSDQILMIGATYAFRVLSNFAVGASAFYVRRDQRASVQRGQVNERTTPQGVDFESFIEVANTTDISDGALVFRVGALWAVSDAWSAGFGCSAQSIHLHGEGALSYALTSSGEPDDPASNPTRRAESWPGRDANTAYPWGCRMGGMWTWPGNVRVSLDLSAHFPVNYKRLDLSAAEAGGAVVRSVLVNDVQKEFVANAAVGVEVWLASRWPLRAGFFTNNSAAPDIPANPLTLYAPSIDLYGATVSAGYLGDDRSINLGAEVQWGSGHDVVVDELFDLISDPTFIRVDREEFRLVFFVSGAIDFAQKTAADLSKTLLDEEEHPPRVEPIKESK